MVHLTQPQLQQGAQSRVLRLLSCPRRRSHRLCAACASARLHTAHKCCQVFRGSLSPCPRPPIRAAAGKAHTAAGSGTPSCLAITLFTGCLTSRPGKTPVPTTHCPTSHTVSHPPPPPFNYRQRPLPPRTFKKAANAHTQQTHVQPSSTLRSPTHRHPYKNSPLPSSRLPRPGLGRRHLPAQQHGAGPASTPLLLPRRVAACRAERAGFERRPRAPRAGKSAQGGGAALRRQHGSVQPGPGAAAVPRSATREPALQRLQLQVLLLAEVGKGE